MQLEVLDMGERAHCKRPGVQWRNPHGVIRHTGWRAGGAEQVCRLLKALTLASEPHLLQKARPLLLRYHVAVLGLEQSLLVSFDLCGGTSLQMYDWRRGIEGASQLDCHHEPLQGGLAQRFANMSRQDNRPHLGLLLIRHCGLASRLQLR